MEKENTIIITGASSGIGRALALQYAQSGTSLSLISRSDPELLIVKEKCISYGAKSVNIFAIDVTDCESVKSAIAKISLEYNIESVFCAAGISYGTAIYNDDIEMQIINTNIIGTLNIIKPIIPIMKKQNYGQIALFSSLAKFIPTPDSAAYILTKNAIASYGESLNILLEQYNIQVSIIMPGFVNSKMSKLSSYKAFSMMPAEKAAYIIKEGIEKRKNYIIFPKLQFFLLQVFSLLPFIVRKYLIKQFIKT
jgi:short-subunit dehydrogenase